MGAPSNFALAFLIHPGDGICLEAVHANDRFVAADVERLVRYFEQALDSLTRDGRRRVRELEVVPPSEVEELRRWSIGPPAPTGGLVHELIAAHAANQPEATAIVDARRAITYRELDTAAKAFAATLRGCDVRPGDCVGLVAGRTSHHIAAVLAMLRIGAVYVPIDTSVPAARLTSMIDQTGLRVVMAERGFAPPSDRRVEVLDLADGGSSAGGSDVADAEWMPSGDDLAYVIYTSGSTGEPKGVAVTHANLAHSTNVRSGVYDDAPGVFLLLSSLAFDSSMVGVFWTLTAGGTLVLPDEDQRHQLRTLAEMVDADAVTHLLALPSVYSSLLHESSAGQLASLRTVIVAGEACLPSIPALHAEQCGQAALYNEYGPTEATVWSHAHRVAGNDRSTVPIGRPIPNSVGPRARPARPPGARRRPGRARHRWERGR